MVEFGMCKMGKSLAKLIKRNQQLCPVLTNQSEYSALTLTCPTPRSIKMLHVIYGTSNISLSRLKTRTIYAKLNVCQLS